MSLGAFDKKEGKREEKKDSFVHSKTGQTVLSDMLYTYAGAVAKLQKRLVTEGRSRDKKGPLLFLEPETNALLALRVILDNTATGGTATEWPL